MSLIHDFTITEINNQRTAELRAEADQNRLARIARAGRPTWWRRGLNTAARASAHAGGGRLSTHRVA